MKRRIIRAAEEPKQSDALLDAIDILKDDFDYIISGLEKLSRSGANATNDAAVIIENISNDLKRYTSDIADAVAE